MKTLFTILSVLVCAVCFGQTPGDVRNTTIEPLMVYDKVQATDTTYSYQGFTAYLVIQTSEVTKEQIDFAKKLTKYVKDQHGILYITIQSGVPPCIPTPTRPCNPK